MIHKMKLGSTPFNKIASGTKVIESRLYDQKRQAISIGDEIIFCENDNLNNSFSTIVKDLLRYGSFSELYDSQDPSLFGGTDKDELLAEVRQFYSEEGEHKYGVVGIKVEKMI
ncbi:MAG: ASCH domain-containing protein [Candidatus Pacebacteria bacterium]|nr:ASCH domain-containing protein [Candidatus Paceibacterota bacterium]